MVLPRNVIHKTENGVKFYNDMGKGRNFIKK